MSDHIVDACTLINLYASGKIQAIIPACGGTFHISEQVQRESLSIRGPDPADASLLIPSPIDLSNEITSGLIEECHLERKEEFENYVNFAIHVDDGEASSLAITLSRKWTLATDDRKAIRLVTESGIPFITTPELVECWSNATKPTNDEIVETLRAIERFARFRPRRGDPLHDWWTSTIARD